MQTTGIVRRIDELGRVVIPKELRRTMKIREGEELEIFADENNRLVLRKYSAIKNLTKFADEYAQALYSTTNHNILIADKDSYITVKGNLSKDFMGREISHTIEKIIMDRKSEIRDHTNYIKLTVDDSNDYKGQIIDPIIIGGDVYGAIILVSQSTAMSDSDVKLIDTAKAFLEQQF